MTTISKDDLLSRIKGSLLGTAIGDALGYPVEFSGQTPDNRVVFGLAPRELDFDGRRVALYSDDTQMTRAVMDGLLDTVDVRINFLEATDHVANRFIKWSNGPDGGHRAPGGTCMRGCHRLEEGIEPLKAGNFDPKTGGGCGAVMRSAPYGWLWYDNIKEATRWAAAHACMTHGAPIGQASSAALAAAVVRAFNPTLEGLEKRAWCIAEAALFAAQRYDEHTARMIAQAMWLASPAGLELRGDKYVLDIFRGWAGHEAIAASIYCFLRHPESYEQAVLLAVNSPGDSDSLGAITGAISGAFLGVDAIPGEWIQNIEKRDQLIDLAERFTEMVSSETSTIELPTEGE
jgi:ADP-ribosylglycohydrolase